MLLLSAGACGYEGSDDVQLAAAVELIHMTTLVHDDVLDEASLRHGRPSVNRSFGNTTAVLLGDYLFARAIALFQRDVPSLNAKRKQAILMLVSAMTVRMIEGELLQERSRGNLAVDEDAYLKMIALKTGEGFAACAQIAAILAHANGRTRSRFVATDRSWASPTRSWMTWSTLPLARTTRARRPAQTSGGDWRLWQ